MKHHVSRTHVLKLSPGRLFTGSGFAMESLEPRVMLSVGVGEHGSVPVAPEGASVFPPTLSSIGTLSAAQNRANTFTFNELYYSSDVEDADGGPISFRVETVSSGTLTKNGDPVVPGETLIGVDESLVWTPEQDVTGVNAAFTVVAFDGVSTSEPPVTVFADVEPRVVHDITPGANSKFTFLDGESHQVTVALSGNGSLHASRAVADGEPGDLLELDGESTDDKTKITISVAGKGVSTNVTDIHIFGALGSLNGPAADIHGEVVVADAVKSVTLHDATFGSAISLGGGDNAAASTIKLGAVGGLDFASTGPIKTFQLGIWNGGSLTAPSITTLKTTGFKGGAPGDFGASVTLTQPDTSQTSLKTFVITGSFRYGSLSSVGSVGSITVGRMQDASIYIGMAQGFSGVAANADDFAKQPVTANLGKFTVKGFGNGPAFADAVIDAFNIGTVDLRALTTTGSGRDFGVAAGVIKSIKFSDATVNGGKSVTLKSLDTVADLADPKKNPAAVVFPVGDFKLTLV